MNDPKNAVWKNEEEEILREWSDKAQVYRWLHARSHAMFRKKHAMFTIPVIVLSTITGTANFAQDRFPPEYVNYFVMGVGSLNILAGIISTIAQFLKIAELNEAHRVASIAWGKFNRRITIELARHPDDRSPVFDFMKSIKEEYDRLMETAPQIPINIIGEFKTEFKDLKEMILPEILGRLETTKIFRPILAQIDDSLPIDFVSIKMEELKKEIDALKGDPENPEEKIDIHTVEEIRESFRKKHGRPPAQEEFLKEYEKTHNKTRKSSIISKV
jgi:hypothetical protein